MNITSAGCDDPYDLIKTPTLNYLNLLCNNQT